MSLFGRASSLDDIPLEWAEKLTPGTFAFAAGKVWGQRDPNALLRLVDDVDNHSMMEHGLRYAAMDDWPSRDPEAAIEFLNSLPQNSRSTVFMRDFARHLSKKDPRLAVELTKDLGLMDNHNGSYIYSNWVKSDPEAALENVRELKLSALEGYVTRNIATQSAGEDPERSVRMLGEIESRIQRSRGLREVATSVARVHPRKVASLAQSIENPYDRAIFLRQAVNSWKVRAEFYSQSQSNFSWIDKLDAPSAALLNRALARYAPELTLKK